MIPFSLCQIILDASDYIQLGGIVSSLIISIVSIYIAIKTLKQNGKTLELNQQILKANREALDLNYKMLESTFRPYVNIYGTITNFGSAKYYIVLKNTGQSGTYISSFRCSHDLSNYFPYDENSSDNFQVPFANIVNSFIAPNQSIFAIIDLQKAINDCDSFEFEFSYTWQDHVYTDKINLSLKTYYLHLSARDNGPNVEKNIAYALQDLVEKLM